MLCVILKKTDMNEKGIVFLDLFGFNNITLSNPAGAMKLISYYHAI